MIWLLAGLGGYLIGTISFTRIVARFVAPNQDLSMTEFAVAGTEETWTYRGVSATSLLERAGWKAMVSVVALDALKAFAPTMAMRLAFPDTDAYALAALAVVVGHVWPVWWRFEGGRGQSSLLGALLAIDVLSIPVAALTGAVVGMVGFTSVYMARNMGPVFLIPWFALVAGVGPQLWFAVGFNVVYWIAVRGDVAEELRARRARGTPELPYPAKLRRAWVDFFDED